MKKSIFLTTIFTLFIGFATIAQSVVSDQILGTWMSEAKDLKVEMFKKDGKYFGKLVWFKSDPKRPPITTYQDDENPNPALRNRYWLGMVSVENLVYKTAKTWGEGTVYDPNSGRTYTAVVRIPKPNTLVVRGFWGIELLGKNMTFYRI